MYFGSPVWPFVWNPPYDAAIKRIAGLGCLGVEMIAWRGEALRDYYTPATIRGLRDLISSEGLTLTNFHHNPENMSSPDPAARREASDNFARAIEVGAALGSPFITCVTPYPFSRHVTRLMDRPLMQEWIVPIEGGLDWTGNYDDFVEELRGACAIAEKAGLRVAIESHPYRWVNSASSMLRLIERTGASNLGLNVDPSHLFPSGDIPHYTVYQLGSKTYHTHFSDNDGQTNAHWRPGKGKVDWAALLKALHDVGYDGVISLELEDVPGSAMHDRENPPTSEFDREMCKSMDYLRAAGAEVGVTFKER